LRFTTAFFKVTAVIGDRDGQPISLLEKLKINLNQDTPGIEVNFHIDGDDFVMVALGL
jgi:hypothetical protein